MINFRLQVLLIVVTLVSLVLVVRITSKTHMEVKDAGNWFILSLFLVLSSIFPGVIVSVSSFLGIELASNAIFSFIIFILLCIVFFLNLKISRLTIKLREIIQEISLLEHKITIDSKKNFNHKDL